MTRTMPRVALITGANGAAGNALLEHLVQKTSSEEWSRIVATSRSPLRKTYTDARVHYVQLDFQQRPGELIDLMTGSCADVTHAFFLSYLHTDDFGDLNKMNTTLFENYLLALTSVARGLKRCVLQTDSMHYGLHLAPVPTPCREDDVRRGDPGDNFCHAQEDFLALLQTNQDWTWNVVRPETVISSRSRSFGGKMALTLAMYFLITRELAEEAKMPTNLRYWSGSEQVSDAALLAEFMLWLATSEDCANEAFNFANGDHFTWRFMWPRLAEIFEAYSTPDQIFNKVEPAMGKLQQEFSLAEWAANKKPVWSKICDAAGVPEAEGTFDCAGWQSQERSFRRSWTCNVSMSKARKYGWTGYMDSFDSFCSAFAALKTQRKIP